jgi:indolepyruvate ferredoxin oxidoreductase beta subunit
MSDVKSIMFVGVGGQGTLLASRLVSSVLIDMGYDVKVSEVHGMSQRGGSVVTYVRYGKKVYSPMVPQSGADIIVAFEQLEALRWIENLKKDGLLIINTQKIMPMPVVTGATKYPKDVLEQLSNKGANVYSIDALPLALKAGTARAVNVMLLGVMVKKLGISKDAFLSVIETLLAPKLWQINKDAFMFGYEHE